MDEKCINDLFGNDSETMDTQYDESAKLIYSQFKSFCEAGFSELQSMQLVMTILYSTITSRNGSNVMPPTSF